MSEKFDMLQFFADGAAGGDGGEGAAESGVNAADAGRSLEDLGVPREMAERHRKRMEKKGKPSQSSPQAALTAPPKGEPDAQDSTPQEGETSAKDGKSDEWDAFFADSAHKERLEQMMAARGKSATEAKNAAAAQLDKMSPMLKLLGQKYGVQPNEDGSYDLDALNEAVTGDDAFFEEKALEMGVSVDVAKKLAHADEIDRQQQEARAKAERDAVLREHFNRVQQQATQIKQLYPDFDLNREMQDPEFVRRTAPGMLPVEDAYVSLHHKEIMQRQAESLARRAKQNAAAAVQSGSARPRENGSASTAAASATPNLKAMSHDQRVAYIKAKYATPR